MGALILLRGGLTLIDGDCSRSSRNILWGRVRKRLSEWTGERLFA